MSSVSRAAAKTISKSISKVSIGGVICPITGFVQRVCLIRPQSIKGLLVTATAQSVLNRAVPTELIFNRLDW
jgi:hypothetical protein